MLSAVKGHYNGDRIVLDENVGLLEGQELIITILDYSKNVEKKSIDLSKYMGRGEKMLSSDAQEYVKELRSNDRI